MRSVAESRWTRAARAATTGATTPIARNSRGSRAGCRKREVACSTFAHAEGEDEQEDARGESQADQIGGTHRRGLRPYRVTHRTGDPEVSAGGRRPRTPPGATAASGRDSR